MRGWNSTFQSVLTVLVFVISKTAVAVPFGQFDPRSLAMGGAGVASATSANAAYYNPALLAMFKTRKEIGKNSQFIIPTFTGRYVEAVETIEEVDEDNFDQDLVNAINAYNANQNAANAQAVRVAASDLENNLDDLLNGPAHVDANAGIVLGIGHKHEGGSIMINRRVVGDGDVENFQNDLELLDTYIEAMEFIETGGDPATAAMLYPEVFAAGGTLQDNLTSSAVAGAMLITEIGMAMAGQFTIAERKFAIGITPKVVHVETFDFLADAVTNTTTDVEDDHEDWNVNLDIGIARQFDAHWRAGFVIKNVRTLKYKTSLGNTLEIKPQIRIGAMHKSHLGLYAVDLDVIKNKPVRRGYETQMLAFGGEWRTLHFLKLRAGASKNLSGVDDGKKILYTAGMHGDIFNGIIDLTLAKNSYERAFGLQLGFRF